MRIIFLNYDRFAIPSINPSIIPKEINKIPTHLGILFLYEDIYKIMTEINKTKKDEIIGITSWLENFIGDIIPRIPVNIVKADISSPDIDAILILRSFFLNQEK
jgi:hypothetical protein